MRAWLRGRCRSPIDTVPPGGHLCSTQETSATETREREGGAFGEERQRRVVRGNSKRCVLRTRAYRGSAGKILRRKQFQVL